MPPYGHISVAVSLLGPKESKNHTLRLYLFDGNTSVIWTTFPPSACSTPLFLFLPFIHSSAFLFAQQRAFSEATIFLTLSFAARA